MIVKANAKINLALNILNKNGTLASVPFFIAFVILIIQNFSRYMLVHY